MIWSDGFVDDDEHPTNPKCNMICDDPKFDQYVRDAAAEVGATKYCVAAYPGTTMNAMGANNCQSWARKVLRKAKRAYLQNEDCPECFRHSSGDENIAP